MLKKKHYVSIGEVLANHFTGDHKKDEQVLRIAKDLADYFYQENPLFQRDKFMSDVMSKLDNSQLS